MRNGYAVKVDKNHKEIVTACRSVGAYVIDIHIVKDACDIIVAYRGQLIPCEIKNGELPPSKRLLTEGEIKCKNGLEAVGVDYIVINSKEEMLHLLNNL